MLRYSQEKMPKDTLTQDIVMIHTPKRLDRLVANYLVNDLDAKLCPGRRVVLDFSQTQFIDDEGSKAVLKGIGLAKQRGAKISLKRVHPQVAILLKMAGVLTHFNKSA
jgi:anti-anti-sigma regulatory factor